MIRLLLLSCLVFSGFYALSGERSPTQHSYVTQVSFDSDQNATLDHSNDQAQKNAPKIDLSAFKNSLKGLQNSLQKSYTSTKNYLFSNTAQPQKNAKKVAFDRLPAEKQPVKIKTLYNPKADTKKIARKGAPAKVAKVMPKKMAKTLPLPSARPNLSAAQIAALSKEKGGFFGLNNRPVASFRNFITPKNKKASWKQKKNLVLKASATSSRGATSRGLVLANIQKTPRNINPRFLTSLIKRELKRLNCFRGAITPNWSDDVRNRIKSIKYPLVSEAPSMDTLSYLKSKDRLKCPSHQDKNAKRSPYKAPIKMVKRPAKNNIKTAKVSPNQTRPIVLRDRTGKIIHSEVRKTGLSKNSVLTSNAHASNALASNQQPAVLFENQATPKDKSDYNFSSNTQTPQRPPALTVGMRPSSFPHATDTSYRAAPPKKKKVRRYKKRKQKKKWVSEAFSND